MIAMLTGTVIRRGEGHIILDCQGIGYEIFVPDAGTFVVGSKVTLQTHEVIREDAHELFGFLDLERLDLFERLLSVSGIGPRGAQKIVSAGTANKVRGSIMNADLGFLTAISGIGKKTAQKIILELKGVLAEEGSDALADDEALQALVGLGYTRPQAVAALPAEGNTEQRVRAALKVLSRSL